VQFPGHSTSIEWFSGENSAAEKCKRGGNRPRGILREGGVPESSKKEKIAINRQGTSERVR